MTDEPVGAVSMALSLDETIMYLAGANQLFALDLQSGESNLITNSFGDVATAGAGTEHRPI